LQPKVMRLFRNKLVWPRTGQKRLCYDKVLTQKRKFGSDDAETIRRSQRKMAPCYEKAPSTDSSSKLEDLIELTMPLQIINEFVE
jgi:hypothetical protein